MEKRRVETPGGPLLYQLNRKQVKGYTLRMGPQGELTLSAPKRVTLAQADAFVASRWQWAQKAWQTLAARPTVPQTHGALLGQALPLILQPGPKTQVLRQGDALLLTLPPGAQPAALLDAYRRQQAPAVFGPALERARARLGDLPLPPVGELALRAMKSRWGSCIPAKGKITLNTHLMKKPLACIEYVALHELCHLQEPNHGPGFYGLLAAAMPDFAQYKAQLRLPDVGI